MRSSRPFDPDELLDDGLLRVPEAAELLAVGKSTIYLLMENGEIPYVRVRGARRIPKRAVTEFAKARLQGGWNFLQP